MSLNCIIVDDNSTELLDTLKLVNTHASLNLVGKFVSIAEAKKFLLTKRVELVIIEVNLSGSD